MARRPALRCTWNQRATTPASSIEVPLHPHLWKYHGTLFYGRGQQRNYASRYDQQRNYASRYDEQKTDGSRSRTAPRLATQFASSHHERTTPRVNTWAWEPPPELTAEPVHPQGMVSHAPDCRVHSKLCSGAPGRARTRWGGCGSHPNGAPSTACHDSRATASWL